MQHYGSYVSQNSNSSSSSPNSFLESLLNAAAKDKQNSIKISTQQAFDDKYNFDDDSDDSMPDLEPDNDVYMSKNINSFFSELTQNDSKCNVTVKVINPQTNSSEVVFTESSPLKSGENIFDKLTNMTKNTPYSGVVSSFMDSKYVPTISVPILGADTDSLFTKLPSSSTSASAGYACATPGCPCGSFNVKAAASPVKATASPVKPKQDNYDMLYNLLGSGSSYKKDNSSGISELLGAGLLGCLVGAVAASSLNKPKPVETKTETKSVEPAKPIEPVKTISEEDNFTDTELKFFEEHFKNYKGDVSKLTPRFKALYDMFHEEPKSMTVKDDIKQIPELTPVSSGKFESPIVGYTIEGKPMRLTKDGYLDLDTSVPGSYFNEMFTNCKVVKLTNSTSCHNGYQYYEGLNIDVQKFKYDTETGNGLYFCRESDSGDWLSYGPQDMVYAWDVKIPHDARVVVYDNKLKADQFILSNKRKIADLVAERINKLTYTGVSIEAIVKFVMKFKYNKNVMESKEVKSAINNHVSAFPASFAKLSEILKNTEVCVTAAKTYSEAFYHMPQNMKYDPTILSYCVMRNPDIMFDIPPQYMTQELCDTAFNGSPSVYLVMPNDKKTLEMSKVVARSADNTFAKSIPTAHKNDREIIDNLLATNPNEIRNIYYKNLNKERCLNAVKADGLAVLSIPIAMLDLDICVAAVTNNAAAYSHIPDEFRNSTLMHTLIDCHPEAISEIESEKITLRMIERVIVEKPSLLSKIKYDKHSVGYLVRVNMKKLIEQEPKIVVHLDKQFFYKEDVLSAIELNNSIYWDVRLKFDFGDSFTIEAVKRGVSPRAIPRNIITMSLLKELVNSRNGLIDELNDRYLSDVLYIEAIKTHNYDYTKITDAYMTPELCAFIASRNPKSSQAVQMMQDALDFALEKAMLK